MHAQPPCRPRFADLLAAVWAVAAPALAAGTAGAQQQPAPAPATVRGVVFDSLTRRPLAGAVVQLVRMDDPAAGRSAIADSAGAFRMDTVATGKYLAGFFHPQLDLLELEVRPRAVEVAPGGAEVRLDLGLPGLAGVRTTVCGQGQAANDSTGLLAGRVRDAESDLPVANATVVLTWSEISIGRGGIRPERRRVPVTTGPAGNYVVCGVPAGEVVTASAEAPGRASGLVTLDVPPLGLQVRDFALGDTSTVAVAAIDTAPRRPDAAPDTTAPRVARGTARLTGTVRGPNGRPVRGARAFVWGTSATATSGESGAFALDALPAGTRTLEVRAIGFEPRRVAVDLASGRAAVADVRMATAVPTLDRVVVMGKASRGSRMLDEFLERKRRNPFGRFVTAADIERTSALAVTDALRMTPGIRIVPTRGFGNAILGRGGCQPAVVLDGMPIMNGAVEIDQLVTPQQIAGIEVYAGVGGAPVQYTGIQANGCGVVLLWTKR